MSATAPPRLALLGLGQRGLQHLRVLWRLQAEGCVRVVALGDAWSDNLDAAKIARHVDGFQPQGILATTEFDRLLGNAKPDALIVAIPPNRHDGQVIRAAQAGVHLLVEKPQSLYLDEALAMDAAIREAGVIATAGFQQRYDTRNTAVRDFLEGRRLVMLTEVSHGSLEAHNVKHTHTEEVGGPSTRIWTANAAWSGTSVVEAGIHPLDLMRYWCGDVAWAQAAYVPRDPDDIQDGADNPYAYAVTFGFTNGAVGNLLISRLRKVFHHDAFRSVLWDHGCLKWEGGDLVAYHYDGPYPPERTPSRDEIRHVLPIPPPVDALDAFHRAFLHAISTRDPSGLRSSFPDALNSLAAVLAANASHALDGERIRLTEFATVPRYARFRARKS
jgi:predicted dehydrogenase